MAGTTKRKPDATNEVSGTGVPKRLKAEMRKQRIIEAAIDLFSKNSFEDTRIDEIAAAANCTTGPVYHFFDGKEEIFIAAYSEVAHCSCETRLRAKKSRSRRLSIFATASMIYLQGKHRNLREVVCVCLVIAKF